MFLPSLPIVVCDAARKHAVFCFLLLSLDFCCSLTHYKLYLVSKVSAKIRGDSGLEPENFRGEGGPQTNKKKKNRCLNFSENEFEVCLQAEGTVELQLD